MWDVSLTLVSIVCEWTGCDLDASPTTCCCAGFGCCRQKIEGTTDSIAFLNAGGTILYRDLQPDEVITVDTRSVVAIEQDVTLGITPNGRFCTCLCGGEGCFSTTLTGPGKVFMQVGHEAISRQKNVTLSHLAYKTDPFLSHRA